MARYTDPTDPNLAADLYGYKPGNYRVHYADGSSYIGRQSASTNRIREAIKKNPRSVVAVEFMTDTLDDECVRAAREDRDLARHIEAGIRVRNQVNASQPKACRAQRRVRW